MLKASILKVLILSHTGTPPTPRILLTGSFQCVRVTDLVWVGLKGRCHEIFYFYFFMIPTHLGP